MNQLKAQSQQTTPKIFPMKPIFKRHTIWRCMKPSDISYINRYKPKMLHHVSITRLSSETLGTSGLRNLRKALKDSKTISSATFPHVTANVEQLTYLLDSTNHWKYLCLFSPDCTEKMDYEFTKSVSTLGKYKKLSQFIIPYISPEQHVPREISTRICHQIKKLHKLEKTHFNLPLYNNPSILNLRLPRSLKYLSLNFNNKPLVPQQQLSSFVTSIQPRCPLLEEMNVFFSDEYQIQPSDAQVWASFFQNAPNLLKKLYISLDFCAEQKSEEVQIFIESLKHLKNLTSLSLSSFRPFGRNQPLAFEKGFFPLVFNSLQSLTQLKELDLRFYCYEFKNGDIQYFVSMLQCLKNLKNLNIRLPSLLSPHQDLIFIAENLRNISNLKTLELGGDDKFNKNSTHILFNNIAHFHLTSLHLDLGPLFSSQKTPRTSLFKQGLRKLVCFWGKKAVHPTLIFSDIQNFTQLSTLNLKLSSFEISNQELKQLSLALQKFDKLSSLTLSFPQLDSDKNFEGLRELLSCFKNLPKLSQLELSFEGDRISNREVRILSTHLADCQSLTSLDLHFKKAADLKGKTLNSLLLGIRGLSKLKYLTLFFRREKTFREKAMSNFLKGLVVLKDLSKLSFTFHPLSRFLSQHVPLPANLQCYENLRSMENFVVGDSRYI